MELRFWGTRGSIASPGPDTLRYGGNTPCVEVRTDDKTLLIFDCGTGARKLGLSLARAGPVRAHLFVSHTHSDHIQGLPFFVPAFLPGSHLTVYGPAGIDRSLPNAVGGQMDYAYFPVPIKDLPSRVDFEELGEGDFSVGEARVRTQYLNHTAPCLCYRVEVGGISLVYATDHEPHADVAWRPERPGSLELAELLHPGDARHAEFLRDADLVIHDAQYTAAEYPAKIGWGHSPVEYVVDVCVAARVRRLALFHHDPSRDDDAVDGLLDAARARVEAANGHLDVLAAEEGAEISLGERRHPPAAEPGPRAPRVPTRARVLVAQGRDGAEDSLRSALEEDGYEVHWVESGAEAVQLAEQSRFDLILLDMRLPDMDGLAASRALRDDKHLDGVPIVILTPRSDEEDVLGQSVEGVTDYMTMPIAVAQFRARVRSWLTRAAEDG